MPLTRRWNMVPLPVSVITRWAEASPNGSAVVLDRSTRSPLKTSAGAAEAAGAVSRIAATATVVVVGRMFMRFSVLVGNGHLD